MQDHHHSLLRLLNASDVREQTRAVFKSLIEHCEDEERLCSFVLESVRDRVSESLQSEIVRRRSCGSPAFPLPKELRVILESEALNDEARRWMADFLLYPIGKRTKTTRRSTRLLDKRNRHTHATRFKNTCYEPQLASTEDCGRFCEVELFPKSNDSVRFSRFRVLVDVFHEGYQKALCNRNLASGSNTVLIERSWMSMFDNGAFHLRFDNKQIYPVPLWNKAMAVIPPSTPIDQKSTLRLRNRTVFRGLIGPDRELVSLHALILQTWYETGLAERLVSDMELVDNMPSITQQVSVLGDSIFSQILQHRLALL